MQLMEMGSFGPGEHTGRWLVDYDPHHNDGEGRIVTTPHRSQARVFDSLLDVMELVREPHGLRTDGKPNRPITAYTLNIERG